MHPPALCTEQEISAMVRSFYAAVPRDEQLGPIFNTFVVDWDHHLSKLTDRWSSILLSSGRFQGVAVLDLSAQLFERWLALFREATAAQQNPAMGEPAYDVAQRIADSLWYGYQMNHRPQTVPTGLRHGWIAPHRSCGAMSRERADRDSTLHSRRRRCACRAKRGWSIWLTAMTDYALRLLMYVAQRPDRLCTIAEIAQAHDISEAHLMKVTH